jgi:hypothetical protein
MFHGTSIFMDNPFKRHFASTEMKLEKTAASFGSVRKLDSF